MQQSGLLRASVCRLRAKHAWRGIRRCPESPKPGGGGLQPLRAWARITENRPAAPSLAFNKACNRFPALFDDRLPPRSLESNGCPQHELAMPLQDDRVEARLVEQAVIVVAIGLPAGSSREGPNIPASATGEIYGARAPAAGWGASIRPAFGVVRRDTSGPRGVMAVIAAPSASRPCRRRPYRTPWPRQRPPHDRARA